VYTTASTWAVVLAGGEGSRLHSLTTMRNGMAVPKQFCSLQGGPSLVQQTLRRAAALAPLQRVCTIVGAQHRVWRDAQLQCLLDDNVIEQPDNRGTAHGVLLPLLHILARDPDAGIVLLPADHYVRDEAVLAQALRQAVTCAAAYREAVFLLGVEPDEPDTELGYIVAENRRHQPSRVVEFVEKPSLDLARTLLDRGALWNTFILAASARGLLSLFDERFSSTIARMRQAVAYPARSALRAAAMADIYRHLPKVDFSHDVLARHGARLQVLPVPACGWTDLGTPQRVARTLQRLPRCLGATSLISDAAQGLDLAAQHWQLEFARNNVAAIRPASEPALR